MFGVWSPISISWIEISTPTAWKRLWHSICVGGKLTSFSFRETKPGSLRYIDNCGAESARWIFLFNSSGQDIQERPELLQTFVRFLARVIVRIAIELQDIQSPLLKYCQPTHFAVIARDINIDHATFKRTLKIFESFSSEQQFRIGGFHSLF